MSKLKIGILVDCLKMDLIPAVIKASELGVDGVQMYIDTDRRKLEDFTPSYIKEVKDVIRSCGLVLSATCGDTGGFMDKETNAQKIERTCRIMDVTRSLGCHVVTAHIGVIPQDESDELYQIMKEAVAEVGEYGANIGVDLAIETGPELSVILRRFIENTGSRGIKVNLDPANLAMAVGEDSVEAVRTLDKYIVHTHAKDGIRLMEFDFHEFLANLPEKMPFQEMPLGEGAVGFDKYLRALTNTGFDGFLTIERESGDNPVEDIRKEVIFLREEIAKLDVM